MVFQYAYILPILIFLWFPLSFGITTLISYFVNQIETGIPFISDTGTLAPESCIFGFNLTIGACLVAAVAYIRYRQVRELLDKENEFKTIVRFANNSSAILGIFAVIGLIMVANFQETNIISIHLVGAALAFGLGTLYLIIQTYISLQIYPKFGHKFINILRILCTLVCCFSNTVVVVLGTLSIMEYKGDIKNLPNWTEIDGGYQYKFWTAVFEWLLLFGLVTFFLLFTYEFRKIRVTEPLIEVQV